MVASIAALFEACKAVVASQPTRRREMDNNAQRLGVLFWHLNAHSLSPNVAEALRQICAALDGRDYATAGQLQVRALTPLYATMGACQLRGTGNRDVQAKAPVRLRRCSARCWTACRRNWACLLLKHAGDQGMLRCMGVCAGKPDHDRLG